MLQFKEIININGKYTGADVLGEKKNLKLSIPAKMD